MRRQLTALAVSFFAVYAMAESGHVDSVYFAPVNRLVFKAVWPEGGFREFERDLSSPDVLRSADGWSGRLYGNGMTDITGPGQDGRVDSYRFEKGRLVRSEIGGVVRQCAYSEPRTAPRGTYPPLLIPREATEKAAKEYSYNQFLHKWDNSGRLAFPFVNPNHAGVLYAQLFLLLGAVAFRANRRVVKVVAGLLSLASAVCLVWTMSRGAWLGLMFGAACFVALGLRKFLKSRAFWIGAGVFAPALVVWGWLYGLDQITRGFDGTTMNWSNAIRLQMWGHAPRMMVDAPGGWHRFFPGTAYVDWYQPLQFYALTPTLINDHLTILVALPWIGRFVYLFVAFWVSGLGVAALVVRRNPLPLAIWLAFATAAWFNPLMMIKTLWIVPLASLFFLFGRWVWSNRRVWVSVISVSAVLSLLVIAGLAWIGRIEPAGYVPVHFDGRATAINGLCPRTWIVDDGTLGGGFSGKDIREYYTYVRKAPSVGYVDKIDDLPLNGIDKLVLAGQAGADWLTRLSEDEKSREHLPKSVLFISPPFSPADVPEGVRALCRPRIVVGEFAALYDKGYDNPPDWVTIVPGMERYILRWMGHVMER